MNRRSFTRHLLAIALTSFAAAMTGLPVVLGLASIEGCREAKVVAGVSVRVDADHCKEQRDGQAVSTEFVDLSCSSLQGEGNVTIEFPRKEWMDIKLRRLGADAGERPGK